MTAIQGSNCATSGTGNPAVATQSQTPGGWYNPLPNPYPYGMPSNGGSIGGLGMNGIYGGGFGGGFVGGLGGQYGPGLINPAVAAYGGGGNISNIYGSYDYQNNNANSALPSYGYNSVVAPTTFTAPLSGNGVDPNSSGSRVHQELFYWQNIPSLTMAGGLIGGGIGLGLWSGTLGHKIKGKPGNIGAALFTIAVALAGGVLSKKYHEDRLQREYTGYDYADNGQMDGSYTVQRGYDITWPKIK
jgi:hypothetical protein